LNYLKTFPQNSLGSVIILRKAEIPDFWKRSQKMDNPSRLQLFEKIRNRYSNFLTAVLWKLTGERELFAEAYQTALLKIWQNAEKLDSPAAAAYIYRIALSANSEAWKKRINKNGHLSFDQCEEPAANQESGDLELMEIVRKAIARLPKRQSQALVMRYLEQQDYKAIAEKLECAEVNVRSNVSKALAMLRQRLGVSAKQEQ
jgi:RNA polymerase sigma factor (sigma-70 family)